MNGVDDVAVAGLHFLRPAWLLALPLLAALVVALRRRGAFDPPASGWNALVDPALRPYVVEGDAGGDGGDGAGAARRPVAPRALVALWALAVLVLSGPTFERREVEVHDAPVAEVVLLDLSASMRADDLRPDRVSRARYKLDELLERGRGMEIGLVAFAERPYTIAPLTDDVETVRAFLPSLAPEIVPVSGSRPDLAIERGVELLERAGAGGGRGAGHLLLVTDAVPDEATLDAARRARSGGHALSVLAVGTAGGAPLRDRDGRFATADDGSIVVPRVDFEALDELAAAGGGVAVPLSADATDLDALDAARGRIRPGRLDGVGRTDVDDVGDPRDDGTDGDRPAVRRALWWIERGPWLVPVLALGTLLAFRRREAS